MAKRLLFLVLILAPFCVAFSGCEKDEKKEVAVGGKGGTATLRFTPMHHSAYIDSITVYIAYNVQDAPSQYDDSVVATKIGDGKAVAEFTGLKKGYYYVLGKGYDPGIFQNVKGGIPVTIPEEDSVYNYTLPVTEDGH